MCGLSALPWRQNSTAASMGWRRRLHSSPERLWSCSPRTPRRRRRRRRRRLPNFGFRRLLFCYRILYRLIPKGSGLSFAVPHTFEEEDGGFWSHHGILWPLPQTITGRDTRHIVRRSQDEIHVISSDDHRTRYTLYRHIVRWRFDTKGRESKGRWKFCWSKSLWLRLRSPCSHLPIFLLSSCISRMIILVCRWPSPWDTLACCWDVNQPTNKRWSRCTRRFSEVSEPVIWSVWQRLNSDTIQTTLD